jgi:uncharacterized protein DUF2793
MVVVAAVEEPPRASPPSTPSLGVCYIVATAPTGAWTGKANCLTAYTSGGWRFVTPFEGLTAYIRSTGTWALYRAGAWEAGLLRGASVVIGGQQVLGSRVAAIPSPTGGAIIDTQARSIVDQILTAMRQHGLIEP